MGERVRNCRGFVGKGIRGGRSDGGRCVGVDGNEWFVVGRGGGIECFVWVLWEMSRCGGGEEKRRGGG